MSLKDYFESDMQVFFNDEEFSEWHIINKKRKLIMIDDESLKELSKSKFQGMSAGEILYCIPVSDYGSKKPKEFDTQEFDNRLMYIKHVDEIAGMYQITLSQNRGE